MAEVSNEQIYNLALEILRDATKIEGKLDEILLDMRAPNRQLSVDRQQFTQQARPE